MNAKSERVQEVARRLRRALRTRQVIQFHTRFEQGRTYGYVASVGPELFLIAEVREGCLLDGFSVYRLRDVRGLEAPHKYHSFAEEALRLKGQRWSAPKVSLRSWSALLSSLAPLEELVVIGREGSYPDEVRIGLISSVDARTLSLQEIDRDAELDREASTHRLSQLTRVGWAGMYERALQLVWAKRHPMRGRGRAQARRHGRRTPTGS